jgi:hypothetical protein
MALIEVALADLASQDLPNYTQTVKKFNVDRFALSRRYKGKTAFVTSGKNFKARNFHFYYMSEMILCKKKR